MSENESKGRAMRRAVCKACIGGMTVVSAGAVGFPVLAFLGDPKRLVSTKPLEVSMADLAPGQAQYAELRGVQIIVLATEEGPRAFNAACTHLGCNVTWDTADGVFRCPCHGAIFDDAGGVVSGPVNAPLKAIPFEVEDGKIIIS